MSQTSQNNKPVAQPTKKELHSNRKKIVELFQKQLNEFMTTKQLDDLEIGVYNWAIKFSEEKEIIKNWNNKRFQNLYNAKAMSVLSNLDPKSYVKNTRLLERVNEKEFKPHEIPFMKAENIFPEQWKSILDSKIKREQFISNDKPEAMTTLFKCGKCKKRQCIFKEYQVRSCDEPMTLFITCLNCGNRWRI